MNLDRSVRVTAGLGPALLSPVMAVLVTAIHAFLAASKTWVAGSADKYTQSAQA